MDNQHKNRSHSRAKGAQARDEGCQMCNGEEDQTETEQDKQQKGG